MISFKEIQEKFDDTEIRTGDHGQFIDIRLSFKTYISVNEKDQRVVLEIGDYRRDLKGIKTTENLLTLSKLIKG